MLEPEEARWSHSTLIGRSRPESSPFEQNIIEKHSRNKGI